LRKYYAGTGDRAICNYYFAEGNTYPYPGSDIIVNRIVFSPVFGLKGECGRNRV